MKKFFLIQFKPSVLQSCKVYKSKWLLKEIPMPEISFKNSFNFNSVYRAFCYQSEIVFSSKENALMFAEKNDIEICYVDGEEFVDEIETKSYQENYLK